MLHLWVCKFHLMMGHCNPSEHPELFTQWHWISELLWHSVRTVLSPACHTVCTQAVECEVSILVAPKPTTSHVQDPIESTPHPHNLYSLDFSWIYPILWLQSRLPARGFHSRFC
jgi:hypothetical protein